MNKQQLSKKNRRRKRTFFNVLLLLLGSCILGIIFICTFIWKDMFDELAPEPVIVNKQSPENNKKKNTNEWNLTLVNKTHKIPESYSVNLLSLKNGEKIDKRIYESLQKMFDDARAEGLEPIVVSGYRTTKEQQSILNDKIKAYELEGNSQKDAKKKALEWVARPGYSEHQMGISVDINADTRYSSDEKVYNWLAKNANKYGFIHRYPSNKTHITGVINEPWHYRYVGVETAKKIYQQGLCLEEYLDEVD